MLVLYGGMWGGGKRWYVWWYTVVSGDWSTGGKFW